MAKENNEQGLLDLLASINERVDRHIQEQKTLTDVPMPESLTIISDDDEEMEASNGDVAASNKNGNGNVHIGGYFHKKVSTELRMVCIEREEETGRKCTLQSLLAEGINHVLRKAGRQPIANEDIRI